MDAIKKALGATVLATITEFATKWLNILHTSAFTHPDWEKDINAEALPWSIGAIIVIYISSVLVQKSKLLFGIMSIFFLLSCGVALGLCYHYSSAIDEQTTTLAVDQLIARWHNAFVVADTLFVSAGACFGVWLVSSSSGPSAKP